MIQNGVHAKQWGDVLASSDMGCSGLVGKPRLDCLRGLPLDAVATQFNNSYMCVNHHWNASWDPWCNPQTAGRPPFGPLGGWSAVVDGSNSGLPDVPIILIEQGAINRSPTGRSLRVLMGTNTNEFCLFSIIMSIAVPHISVPLSNLDLSTISAHMVKYHQNWNISHATKIAAEYNTSSFHYDSARIASLLTDAVFRCGTRAAAAALAKAHIETYLYQFNYHGSSYKEPDSLHCQLTSQIGCGVSHGSELEYVFGHKGGLLHPEAKAVSDMMGQLWTNFAKELPPSSSWPTYNSTQDILMMLGPTAAAVKSAQPRCDFWASLPQEGTYPH